MKKVFVQGLGFVGSAMLAAIAQSKKTITIVSTWPRDFPGLGTSAQRLAARITDLSNGALTTEYFAAGVARTVGRLRLDRCGYAVAASVGPAARQGACSLMRGGENCLGGAPNSGTDGRQTTGWSASSLSLSLYPLVLRPWDGARPLLSASTGMSAAFTLLQCTID